MTVRPMLDAAQLLLESLVDSPLLIQSARGFGAFDRSLLGDASAGCCLNFQQKLGHLYEDALAVLLEASPSVALLARNLQVATGDGRTIGELDYLLLDTVKQRAIHLELAVKFYLAVELEGEWQFPGPDPRDNWQNKLERMCTHQLSLTQQPEAQALLKSRFDLDNLEVQQLVYGCLFYPVSTDTRTLPEAVNVNCRMGRWLYLSEREKFFAGRQVVRLIPKTLWPIEPTAAMISKLETVTVQELFELASERCTLFCFDDQQEPIFLVPDDWLAGSTR